MQIFQNSIGLQLANNQGGVKKSVVVYDGKSYDVVFPTAFTSKCIGVFLNLDGEGPRSGASVCYSNQRTKTGFKMVTDVSSAQATHDIFYLAIGL